MVVVAPEPLAAGAGVVGTRLSTLLPGDGVTTGAGRAAAVRFGAGLAAGGLAAGGAAAAGAGVVTGAAGFGAGAGVWTATLGVTAVWAAVRSNAVAPWQTSTLM